jgi:hypothetical protein
MFELCLKIVLDFVLYVVSIGLSDAIELYFNPLIHKCHNAPDIIHKSFENYTYFDAFLSGVICTWIVVPVVIVFLLLGCRPPYIFVICLINILIPIIYWITGWQENDMFAGHKALYVSSIVYFIVLLIVYGCDELYMFIYRVFYDSHD